MSDLVLGATTRGQSEVVSLADMLGRASRRLAKGFRREQTGQDMVEYAGVLLIVAIIIAAVVASPLGTIIGSNVTNLVHDVFTGTKPPTKP